MGKGVQADRYRTEEKRAITNVLTESKVDLSDRGGGGNSVR